MYTVVIADDEPVIRKGLRETIEWDKLGLEIAGVAADGAQALDLIKRARPDVLITDIRMPEMNGIELIRETKKLSWDVKIIILSGFSDYAYLKEAIRLGVESYLLKPIDNEELVSNLKDVVSNIERDAFVGTQLQQSKELLKSNTLNRLVAGNIGQEEFREKAAFLQIPIKARLYTCAVCAAEKQPPAGKDGQLTLWAIQSICNKLTAGAALPFIDSGGNVVLLFTLEDAQTARKDVTRMLESVVANVREALGVTLLIGVGAPADRIEGAHACFESALRSLDTGVFIKSGGVIWHDEASGVCDASPKLTREDDDRLKELVRKGDGKALERFLDTLVDSLADQGAVSLSQAHSFLMQVSVRLTDHFRQIYGELRAFREPADFDYARLLTLRHGSDMRQWLALLVKTLLAENEVVLGKSGSVMGLALAYIDTHYAGGLTIKQVAAHCHINTSYFGQVFRKETGKSFTDYVNELRVAQAKKLLLQPDLKVYEIAEKVGFTDYHYFLKIFKKVTGITPTDLRN